MSESLLILVALALAAYLLVGPALALGLAMKARRRIAELEGLVAALRAEGGAIEATAPAPTPEAPEAPRDPAPAAEPVASPCPPPLPPPPAEDVPSDVPPLAPVPRDGIPGRAAPFSLEQFLGVKLFAWLGGLALFAGLIFFVKYAFEHNLVPPALRVAIGFTAGALLLAGGLVTHRRREFRVLAQSLCATGLLTLYGVSYAAHALYRFPAFGPATTFALLGLLTFASFLVALRLDAAVVAVLGMLGGFLSPFLLPSVGDQAPALFGYIALLDLGLLALVWRGRWSFLAPSAAAGTVLVEIDWWIDHFAVGGYSEGTRTCLALGILAGFASMFLAAAWSRRNQPDDLLPTSAALGVLAAAMAFAFHLLTFDAVAGSVFLLYGFVLLLNLGTIVAGCTQAPYRAAPGIAAAITLGHLVYWTLECLEAPMLARALAVYLAFGALHALWPLGAARLRPGRPIGPAASIAPWIMPIAVALTTLPMLVLPEVSWLVWPALLLANLLAIAVSAALRFALPVLAALTLTLLAGVVSLMRQPHDIKVLPPLLLGLVGFAVLFGATGLWWTKRLRSRPSPAQPAGGPPDPAALIPVASCSMPFVLLVLMVLRLPLWNPSPVFGAAMLFVALLLGLALIARQASLVPGAAVLLVVLEAVWHMHRLNPAEPLVPLAWYLGGYAVFTAFPFLHRRLRGEHSLPWIASALAAIGHFLLVHDLVRKAWPNPAMGLLPAAFAIPALLSLVAVKRAMTTMDGPARLRLAWLGGVALLFITLVFPIQLDRQWLTVSWALEGACLIWLFRRIPHPGLLATGLALLLTAFVRLSLNPAVLTAYPRSGTPILNWHLHVYGLTAAAQFLGAIWLAEARRHFRGVDLKGVLHTLGGILLFLLLNIEIADFFTPPGERFVTFEFAGDFARDMTCTIAWGLFALATLTLGVVRRARGARYAAIALLIITLLKLFLHDLATIESIHRIAALVGVGSMAFVASFLYQRFYAKPDPP